MDRQTHPPNEDFLTRQVRAWWQGILRVRDWLDGIEPEQKPEPPEKACQENLCQIQVAKALWAQDYGKSENDLPLAEDLYGRYTGESPICPTGGRYTIGVLRVVPHCSIHGPLKETYPEKPETR